MGARFSSNVILNKNAVDFTREVLSLLKGNNPKRHGKVDKETLYQTENHSNVPRLSDLLKLKNQCFLSLLFNIVHFFRNIHGDVILVKWGCKN